MRKIMFLPEKDGFYGAYWANKQKSNAAIILMIGDDSTDYMAKRVVKWFHGRGINAMTMSPARKDYGHHNYPLERIEIAIERLKSYGNEKIGIIGASTTGTLALTAASFFSDINLTIALTPSDFIWQGFMQGNRDGCKEWPMEGESLFTYKGKPLSYMPFVYKHPEYWNVIKSESKRTGDMLNSLKLFEDSERAHPLTEEEFIKVENIKGKLILIGAADDCLWNTVKYINRIEERLKSRPHECKADFAVFEHGTHFIFPQSLLNSIIPFIGGLFVKMAFKAAKEYPKECKQTRLEIDKIINKALDEWKLT